MTISYPTPGSAPNTKGALSLAWIKQRFLELHVRLIRAENTLRNPPIPLVHELQNAGHMSQAQHGHAAKFSEIYGKYVPAPVLATMLFHQIGSLVANVSPPQHSRVQCRPIAVAADMGTYGSPAIFRVLINGVVVGSPITINAPATGRILFPNPSPTIDPYIDLVTVETVDPGSGNSDLVIHVELGVLVGGSAGPVVVD